MQLEIYKNIDISHLINCLKLLILKLLNILNISINNTFIFNYNLEMARTIKNKRKLNKKTTNKLKISRQNYSPRELQEAVEMLNSKQMSLRVAAAAYGVPSTTISDHKNKVSKSNKIGRPPILSQEIEKLLVDGLIKLADWGFGLTELQIKRIIQKYTITSNQNLFKNGVPGRKFFKGFNSRWGNIVSIRLAQNLPVNRAASLTTQRVDQFFSVCKKYYDFLNIHNKKTRGTTKTD